MSVSPPAPVRPDGRPSAELLWQNEHPLRALTAEARALMQAVDGYYRQLKTALPREQHHLLKDLLAFQQEAYRRLGAAEGFRVGQERSQAEFTASVAGAAALLSAPLPEQDAHGEWLTRVQAAQQQLPKTLRPLLTALLTPQAQVSLRQGLARGLRQGLRQGREEAQREAAEAARAHRERERERRTVQRAAEREQLRLTVQAEQQETHLQLLRERDQAREERRRLEERLSQLTALSGNDRALREATTHPEGRERWVLLAHFRDRLADPRRFGLRLSVAEVFDLHDELLGVPILGYTWRGTPVKRLSIRGVAVLAVMTPDREGVLTPTTAYTPEMWQKNNDLAF